MLYTTYFLFRPDSPAESSLVFERMPFSAFGVDPSLLSRLTCCDSAVHGAVRSAVTSQFPFAVGLHATIEHRCRIFCLRLRRISNFSSSPFFKVEKRSLRHYIIWLSAAEASCPQSNAFR